MNTKRNGESAGLLLLAAAALCLASPARAVERPDVEGRGGAKLELRAPHGCPLQLLRGKSRVSSSLERDPWARLRPTGRRKTDDREYGSGESHLTYHVGFKNRSRRRLVAATFVWQAFDAEGHALFERKSEYKGQPVAPGGAGLFHESEMRSVDGVALYRLTVVEARFDDGSVWIGSTGPTEDGSR